MIWLAVITLIVWSVWYCYKLYLREERIHEAIRDILSSHDGYLSKLEIFRQLQKSNKLEGVTVWYRSIVRHCRAGVKEGFFKEKIELDPIDGLVPVFSFRHPPHPPLSPLEIQLQPLLVPEAHAKPTLAPRPTLVPVLPHP